MCKHRVLKKISVIRRANPFVKDGWHTRSVDSCIADEIQELNKAGVITEQCCCGHGKGNSNCLIAIESKNLAEKMGYIVKNYNKQQTLANRLELVLKTGTYDQYTY